MGRQPNILLVDDDLHVRQALGEALIDENYQVALAASGPEAVSRLQDKGERAIDAVLLDLRLGPENGWNIFSRLTSLQPGLPVIIMTGAHGEEVPAKVRGCVALMEKPLDLRRLFETLRALLPTRGSLESESRSAA